MKIKRLLVLMLSASLICSTLSACKNSINKTDPSSGAGDTPSQSDSAVIIQTADINGLVIVEAMSRNNETLQDENGNSPDYISLYNGGDSRTLAGCYLSDNKDNLKMYPLPDVTINKGEYFTVLCDSLDTASGDSYHANFSISADGEKVYLTDSDGSTSELYIPAMPADIAYGLVLEGNSAGEYHYFKSGAPGKKNTSEHSASLSDICDIEIPQIILSEYMTSNKSKAYDNYGATPDWIELYNAGEQSVDLSGMFLSDELSKPNKWKIPDGVSIGAGEYLIIWCDGLDEYKDGHIHSSFKLSNDDSGIILTDQIGLTVFAFVMLPPEKDTSCGIITDGGYGFFIEPTPGKANTTNAVVASIAPTKATQDVYISEAAASSNGGVDCDWIELSNNASYSVDLSGWGIGKNPTAPEYTFSGITAESGGYILLYADGGNGSGEGVHLPFKISLDGDILYLFDNEGYCCDTLSFDALQPQHTCGKVFGGDTVYYDKPTPKAKNSSTSYKGYTQLPALSNAGGYAKKDEVITLSGSDAVTVRYTTDGTLPDPSSGVFSSYTVSQNSIIKMQAYCDGYLPSPVYSATYIIDSEHDIPIVCISADPDDLYSNDKGIFAYGYNYESDFPYVGANFWQDWEREASFEYYSSDGARQLGCQAGIKVFGQFSRAYAQKSFSLHFRGKYGCSSVEYPFFEGNPVDEFSSLVVRAGGQDQGFTRIRDALCSEVFSEYSSIAYMDWQPVAVYINGEYYGFYDLREKINESYFEAHEGIDEDNIDILKGNGRIVIAGDNTDYYDMLEYVKNHDMSKKENYDYICGLVDIDNYIDYLIAEIFFCNTDTGNIKFYREHGGKWKWVIFDLDMAMRTEATWETDYNSIKNLFNPEGHGSNNSFSTVLQCGLLKNEQFKQKFINRYAELLNTAFQPENMNTKLDEMAAIIDSEMVLHGDRWEKPTYSSWKSSIKALKDICNKRYDVAKKQLIKFMSISQEEQDRLFK